jgi:pyruvate/2-oxoglutarate dehydrogenase complex dihydrolipoamide dehydrogenase (E3) component
MEKTDILIIGGGPAGFTCALSARNTHPQKKITIIRKDKTATIPCGIPYVLSTLEKPEDNILGDKPLIDNDIKVVIDEVVDFNGKKAITATEREIEYEKLVIATGSSPGTLPIKGAELDGVYTIKKDFNFLRELKNKIKYVNNIVIVGGGFIGFEVADELVKLHKKVTIVEIAEHCLSVAFDDDFCELAENEMKNIGVDILTCKKVKEIKGINKVSSVILGDETSLDADMVIISVGYQPNIDLAEKMGLDIGKSGAIWVNEYMRTSNPDVFAVGDCAEKKEFFSRDAMKLMLASTAMAEGRLAGSNLYILKVVREFKGTLGTVSTRFGGLSLGGCGLTEKHAKSRGFGYVVGNAEAPDRHPGKINDVSKIKVKLIFSAPYSHTLLGGQIAGGKSVGEMTNILSVMIQNGLKDIDIDTVQIGTHPLLTSSPIAYPIIKAAVDAILKRHKE